MSNLFVDYTIIIFYMLAVVGIGFLCTNKNESTKNYLLGDGKIPFFAVGLSMMMALFSSISIVQAPGEIFNNSMTYGCFNQIIVWLQIPIYLIFTSLPFFSSTLISTMVLYFMGRTLVNISSSSQYH